MQEMLLISSYVELEIVLSSAHITMTLSIQSRSCKSIGIVLAVGWIWSNEHIELAPHKNTPI